MRSVLFRKWSNLLHFNCLMKRNRLANLDMKHLSASLNSDKMSLNVQKTKWMIFNQRRKILEDEMKIKLNEKRIYFLSIAKYLTIKPDGNLNWNNQINDLAAKLNRANALLFKRKNYVNQKLLGSIYFEIFDSRLNYSSLIWAQNSNTIHRVFILLKKGIRVIYHCSLETLIQVLFAGKQFFPRLW